MRVKFMNQTVTLKNNMSGTDFGCEWNGYHLVAYKSNGVRCGALYNKYDKPIATAKGKTNTDVIMKLMNAIEADIARIEEESKQLALFRNYRKIHQCPFCDSKRLFRFRLDSDWASGAGDYYPLNDDSLYTEEELQYDSFNRPDVDVYHCLDCDRIFE